MLAVILWGMSMFLPKLAVKTLPPLSMIVYFSVFFLVAAVVMQAFFGFKIDFDIRGILIALGVGISGTIAQLLYIFSIRNGPMSQGMVITSLYPGVSTLLAFFILHEKLSVQQGAGIVLGICSLILMVVACDDKA